MVTNDLERENARLATMVARLVKENSLLLNRVVSHQNRVDNDDISVSQTSNRRHMWAIMGPTAVLPGSVFYLRSNAINYAVETMGMKWDKCRRMGYVCDKVYLVPTVLDR